MKAVQASQFGSPSVLTVVDVANPTPGPGQIAIDVTHAAVGLIDVLFRQGQFKDVPGMAQPPFIPGLEVAGTVRALGDDKTGFAIGENVVSMSAGAGTGGYASVYIAPVHGVVSIENSGIDPALAVSVIPNAAMAYVALTQVANLAAGESILVHGALGGFSSAFPGIARQLGASRIVGTVRSSKLEAAVNTKLPYDRIVDSAELPGVLDGEKFDVIVDPVGGAVRSQSFASMKPGSRLIVAGNASGDWAHNVKTNDLWFGSMTVAGFNARAFLSSRPQAIQSGLAAAVKAVASGLGDITVDVLPFSEAVTAHQRMENRHLNGRIVLIPEL